ncbi:hypothetical protein LPB41_04075 [Thalassospira sp. MA62]|nr:hypothetical protein [Thalassospira sp. MA62]
MLYILESAFDESQPVEREGRAQHSGLDAVIKTTADSLKTLKDRLEQSAT